MNTYRLEFSYAGQIQTLEKQAPTERKARLQLYDQLGDSQRLRILKIEKI